MKVAVDGIIYQLQEKGGISRLFNEILPRMCDLDNSLHIKLFTHGQLRQRLPEHERINHCAIPESHTYLRTEKIWKPFVQGIQRILDRVMIGRGKKQIWHSTYYTMPQKWDGFFIVTVHDMIFERFPDLYKGPKFDRFRDRKRLCIQYADAVICVSQTTREELQRYYQRDLDSVYVVYHGGSNVFRKLSQKQYNEKKTIEQPFLLYIGSRTSYKNSETMFKAYSVWPQRQEVSLVVVGQPWSADEVQFLKELGIQDKVNLLTDADDETLCRLYNQSTAFVYPSLYEGFGIPLLEAMACGSPIIASRIPSTIEVADDCPVYFEPINVDDLIRAFNVTLAEGRNSKRIQKGLEKTKLYSWDKAAAQTLELYREIGMSE